ncbi:hypothetical protein BIW11_13373 [Tropilaelaps mercedesae]|uniref:Uncharacterized protein n=1 Tax=Tropilaelaps mercedesae TaxID=418985 RepID=A0A1V9X2F2_9ACAR|nr:hypothetical protein BIW11_13373 [Tropilaelaps mercedesae]
MSYRCLILKLLSVICKEIWLGSSTINKQGLCYFLKHFLCTIYLTYKTQRTPLRFPEPELHVSEYTPVRAGLVYPDNEWEQERPKSLKHLKKKEDLHIFEGSHIESGCSLLLRLSRLQEGLCQAFAVLQLGGGQILTLQNEVRLDLSDRESYQGCGFKLECLAPMRRWRITFNGLMYNQQGEDTHVKFGGMCVYTVRPESFTEYFT